MKHGNCGVVVSSGESSSSRMRTRTSGTNENSEPKLEVGDFQMILINVLPLLLSYASYHLSFSNESPVVKIPSREQLGGVKSLHPPWRLRMLCELSLIPDKILPLATILRLPAACWAITGHHGLPKILETTLSRDIEQRPSMT